MSTPDSTVPPRPGLRAWYALTVIIAATLFGMVDRQILVLVTEPLKREMGVTDLQIGLLQGVGPGLFAAVGVVVLGWLADRTARQTILAVCVVLWSLATAGCGLAQNFHQLLVASIAIALGEAALGPVFYSMVPDLFPGRSRMTANLVYFGAVVVGGGFGVALSGAVVGFVQAHRASLPAALAGLSAWRIAFFVVAAPGPLLAAAVALIGSVARRHEKGAPEAGGGVAAYFRGHWRTAAGLYISTGFCGLALLAIMAWTPVMVIRILGASATEAGYGFGGAVVAGSIVGVLLAGAVPGLLRGRFGVMTPVRIFQASLVLMLAPTLMLLMVERPWQVYGLVAIQLVMATAGAALTPTLLQDIAPDRIRGRLIAINSVFYSAMASLAPVLVGAVSDRLAGQPRALLCALVIVAAPSLAAAALILAAVDRPFRRTIALFAPA